MGFCCFDGFKQVRQPQIRQPFGEWFSHWQSERTGWWWHKPLSLGLKHQLQAISVHLFVPPEVWDVCLVFSAQLPVHGHKGTRWHNINTSIHATNSFFRLWLYQSKEPAMNHWFCFNGGNTDWRSYSSHQFKQPYNDNAVTITQYWHDDDGTEGWVWSQSICCLTSCASATLGCLLGRQYTSLCVRTPGR